nr:uncharacterized protein LOC109155154 [Ipomoea batatas]
MQPWLYDPKRWKPDHATQKRNPHLRGLFDFPSLDHLHYCSSRLLTLPVGNLMVFKVALLTLWPRTIIPVCSVALVLDVAADHCHQAHRERKAGLGSQSISTIVPLWHLSSVQRRAAPMAPFSRYEVPNGQDSGDTLLYTAVHSQSEDIRAQYSDSDLQAGGAINSSAEAHGIPHQGQTGTPALGFLAQVQKMRKRSYEDYGPLVNGLQLDNLMNEAKCREVVINSWHSSSGRDILSRMEACSKEVWRWGKLFSTNFKRRISFWERLRSDYLSQFNPTDSPTCNKWTQLWNLPLPPKVKSLIWQACTDSIPTAVNLATRRVNCPQTCVLCEKELETTAHIFIYCDVARECWRNLTSISLDPNLEMAEWLGKNLDSMETVSICLLLTTCWKLWQIRNNKLWNNLSFQRNTIFAEAAAYLDAWNLVQRKVVKPCTQSHPHRWIKPPPDHMKLNVDAANDLHRNTSGLGFILRNSDDHFMAALELNLKGYFHAKMAEALGVREALKWIKELGVPAVQVESDALIVIEASPTSFISSLALLDAFDVAAKPISMSVEL